MNRLSDHRALASALWTCYLATVSSPAFAAGDFNLHLGQRHPDRSSFELAGTHPEAALEASFGPHEWPVAIDIFLAGARDEYKRPVGDPSDPSTFFYAQDWVITVEPGLGIRKTWSLGHARPYLAGGGLLVYQIKGTTYGPEEFVYENGAGGWISGGATYSLGGQFHVGLAARHTFADIDGGYPANGSNVAVALGWRWSKNPER